MHALDRLHRFITLGNHKISLYHIIFIGFSQLALILIQEITPKTFITASYTDHSLSETPLVGPHHITSYQMGLHVKTIVTLYFTTCNLLINIYHVLLAYFQFLFCSNPNWIQELKTLTYLHNKAQFANNHSNYDKPISWWAFTWLSHLEFIIKFIFSELGKNTNTSLLIFTSQGIHHCTHHMTNYSMAIFSNSEPTHSATLWQQISHKDKICYDLT